MAPRQGLLSFLVPVAAAAAATLAACAPEPDGPEPNDPVVYDASGETRDATGIAKWGFGTDNGGTTTFHGYGAHNEQVVELRHTFQITGPLTRRFVLKMSGPGVAGSVQIDYESRWRAETQTAGYVARVIENTIPRGGAAARILQRVAPDAKTIPANAAAGTLTTDSVKTTAKTLNLTPGALVGSGLVDENGNLVTCCCQLTNNGASLAGSTVSECGLVGASDSTLTQSGLVNPLDLPRGGVPEELIVGSDGTPLVDSPWVPPYNIVDNHCHDAAAANVSSTNGYVACQSISATTTWGGHTVNWAPDPTKKDNANAFCIYEPQSNGLTLVDGAACCWEGPANTGTPDLTNAAAAKCAKQMCGDQYQATGSPNGATIAKPAGQRPLTAKNCNEGGVTKDVCNACCTTQADDTLKRFPDTAKDVADYRTRCATSCNDLALTKPIGVGSVPGAGIKSFESALMPADVNTPPDASATRCLASLVLRTFGEGVDVLGGSAASARRPPRSAAIDV